MSFQPKLHRTTRYYTTHQIQRCVYTLLLTYLLFNKTFKFDEILSSILSDVYMKKQKKKREQKGNILTRRHIDFRILFSIFYV